MFDWIRQIYAHTLGPLRRAPFIHLALMPCLVGATTGAAAIGFVELLALVQRLFLGSTDLPLHVLPNLPWYRILLAPAVGGLLVGLLIARLAPEAEGHGVPEVIEAVTLRGGHIRRRVAAIKALASAVTIGSGGSVGREGPIVQIGAALGSALGQVFRLPPEQLRNFAACGAAAGIAAVFNAPIAGAFFSLEVVLGNFAMPFFSPVILASVIGTVVSRAYFGDHPAFIVPTYELQSAYEIPAYALLGLLTGAVGAAFVSAMGRFDSLFARLPVAKPLKPALGGLVLGILILCMPNLYGVGYGTMDAALQGALTWQWLALLLPAKMLATCITLASGGSGGVFLPALYVGSLAGGLYGTAVHALLPDHSASSGAYALVGMAGVLSAATHSPLTSLILLFELSGDYAIILPVMIVVTLATLTARLWQLNSLYTLALSRKGLALQRQETLALQAHTVAEIQQPATNVVGDRADLAEVVQTFLSQGVAQLYVTDTSQRFLGTISAHDLLVSEVRELSTFLRARDLVESDAPRVGPTDSLAGCLEEFTLANAEQLPVVDDTGRLLGVVTKSDVLRLFNNHLIRQQILHLAPAAAEHPPLPGGLALEWVRTPPTFVGKSLREADIRARHGVTVVAVQHQPSGEEQLPNPDAPLAAGDLLAVLGPPEAVRRFRLLHHGVSGSDTTPGDDQPEFSGGEKPRNRCTH